MDRPSSVESLLERLAILDQQIETLQMRRVAMQQRSTMLPTEDLEQTLKTLAFTRTVHRARIEQMQRHEGLDRPWPRSARETPGAVNDS